MQSSVEPITLAPPSRRRSLPAVQLPVARERRREWAVASLLLHALLIGLLVSTPVALHEGIVFEREQGAGGASPAGGGGGGRQGTGGLPEVTEHLQFIKIAPPPQPIVAVIPPAVVPPRPVVPPPQEIKAQELTPAAKPDVKIEPAKTADIAAATPGAGGGSGRDGSAGNGPGSGGGVGSGVGLGRGSGLGPGTGGGNQANYPPSPTELFIPPLPMPDRVRGFHLVAEYDIDETGKIVDFTFTPTRDKDYNKRLEEVLKSFRFRPGSRPDGTAIRMKAQIVYDF